MACHYRMAMTWKRALATTYRSASEDNRAEWCIILAENVACSLICSTLTTTTGFRRYVLSSAVDHCCFSAAAIVTQKQFKRTEVDRPAHKAGRVSVLNQEASFESSQR